MKLNWGTKIAVVYTVFAAAMIFMLLRSCGVDSPLIEDNYYNKELQFQSLKTFQDNVVKFNKKPIFKSVNDQVVWVFDSASNQGAKGTIVYKHLSEPNYDREDEFSFDEVTELIIPRTQFNKGIYQAEIFWYTSQDTFYSQQQISL